jgi:hypothetical protein
VAAGNRQVVNLISMNRSQAKIKTNQGEGEIIKEQITFVTQALKQCQANLGFKDPKKSLLQYYKY